MNTNTGFDDTGKQTTIRTRRVTRTCSLSVSFATHAIPAHEWDRHCKVLETMQRDLSATEVGTNLTFAEGAGPNAHQRKQVADVASIHAQYGAIVSASTPVRAIVTAIGWLGARVKAFTPEEWRQAFEYCGIRDESERARLEQLALQFESELGAQLRCLDPLRGAVRSSRASR